MTPEHRIRQLERDNARLVQQVDTQAGTIERYRRQCRQAQRQLAKERGRSVPMQELINHLRAQLLEEQSAQAQAERCFNDE